MSVSTCVSSRCVFRSDAGGHIDDLSSLLDIESNFNTDDFIPNLPDELHVSVLCQ